MRADELTIVVKVAETRLGAVEVQLAEARKLAEESRDRVIRLEAEVAQLKTGLDKAASRFWQFVLTVTASVAATLFLATLSLKKV